MKFEQIAKGIWKTAIGEIEALSPVGIAEAKPNYERLMARKVKATSISDTYSFDHIQFKKM